MFKKLQNLLQTRAALVRRQNEIQSSRATAQRAVDLCDKLAEVLPQDIAALEATPTCPVISVHVAPDDGLDDAVSKNLNAIAALKRMMADLPDIRKHWAARLAALA